jgi:hypothetical protein
VTPPPGLLANSKLCSIQESEESLSERIASLIFLDFLVRFWSCKNEQRRNSRIRSTELFVNDFGEMNFSATKHLQSPDQFLNKTLFHQIFGPESRKPVSYL